MNAAETQPASGSSADAPQRIATSAPPAQPQQGAEATSLVSTTLPRGWTAQPPWLACHCKPRREKKFAELMRALGFVHYLPLHISERRYESGIKRFTKPLFPGYVFAQVPPEKKRLIYQQDLLARAIEVEDTPRLLAQLADIHTLIASGLTFTLSPQLAKGERVRIISGPLKGVEGQVEDPQDPRGGVLLCVDVLQQGLLVPIPAVDLKLLR